MTYHSAKGLEFSSLYGRDGGGHFATPTQHCSERRRRRGGASSLLCGITCAQEELTLSLPLSRQKWGKQRETYVSRFLYERWAKPITPSGCKQSRQPERGFEERLVL